jgi:ABC-2 type transport system ATP-binding protein
LVALDTPRGLRESNGSGAIVSWEQGGKKHEKTTPTPTAFVCDLATKHAGIDGEVPGLAIRRPTLEDIYLDLVGHESEDAS